MTIFLYEFSYLDPADDTLKTLRISSEPYTTLPTDTPANTRYDDRVSAGGGGSFERWMFAPNSTFGDTTAGAGNIRLDNNDRQLDSYKGAGFDLRTLTIYTVESAKASYASRSVFAVLTVQSADWALNTVEFTLRDPLYALSQAAQTATFAGTNVGTSDLEGTSDTILGRVKPFIIGKAYRFSPPLANSSSLIYAMHHDADGNPAALTSIDEVLDGANAITLDTAIGTSGDFASAALLAAATIGAGKYATCLAKGLIRLQTKPTYVLWVSATEGSNAAARTMAQCVKRMMTNYYGISDFDTASVTQLDTDNSAVVGTYVDNDRNGMKIIADLMRGDAAFCLPKISGQYFFGRLVDPATGTSVETITENESLGEDYGFKLQSLSDPQGGIPPWQTIVQHSFYHRALTDSEIAGAVSAANREGAKLEYRSSTPATDSTVLDTYLSSPVHKIESRFTSKTDADTAATRLQALRGVFRGVWLVPVQSDELLDVGDVITLQDESYDLTDGKKGVILGYSIPELTDGKIIYGVLV